MEKSKRVINEDFATGGLRELPFDREHSALGEYHFYAPEGDCGIWYDPVANYNYRGASWIVTEREGKFFCEQMRVETHIPHKMYPMLICGDSHFCNVRVGASIRKLHKDGLAGLAVCVQNALNFVAVVLQEDCLQVLRIHKESCKVLFSQPFLYDCDTLYHMVLDCNGQSLSCYINEELQFEYCSALLQACGKNAIIADCAAQFTDFFVDISEQDFALAEQKKHASKQVLKQNSQKLPQMKLAAKFDLQDFGTGRQVRFGKLPNGLPFMVFAQCQKRIHKDAYARISCLTAMDFLGNVLWQIGTPMRKQEFGLLSADLPVQIYDFDGDGQDEVIFVRDWEIFVVNGQNGSIKQRAFTPKSHDDGQLIGVPFRKYAFNRINADCIRIANLSGNAQPRELLIKDRYCRLFALDNNLKLMWEYKGGKNTGHFPYTLDINGDGKEEIFCGYDLISHEGKKIWTLPIEVDHTDEIIAGRFGGKFLFALTCGTQGFVLADEHGNIVSQDFIGHAQRVSSGKFRANHEYEFCVSNFWGHNSIIYYYDHTGKPLWEMETQANGNVLTPVNWVGDGSSLILLNAHCEYGGLIDGNGTKVLDFLQDGHPHLCCDAHDLLGDARDEIVVWDTKYMYVYTQSDTCKDAVPVLKYASYNNSNYRGEYAFLHKKDLLP